MKRIMNSNKLIGKTYSLGPLTLDDITEEYIAWLNNPIVNKFLEVRHVNQTIETVTEYINEFYKDHERYIWGIYSIEDRLIGTVNLTNINRYHNVAVLGLMIGNSDFWGKSASEEAMRLVLDFAFDTLGLNRVTGGCYSTNIGMIFTFKRLGFTREGVMRKSVLEGDKYIDSYLWGIISDEWKNG
jgi:[ribosomal protein S5]-alanine N-acetyltransferase